MSKKRARQAETCPKECGALCCSYVVKRLEPPRRKIDWDELYWFLAHDKVSVFIENRIWYLMVDVPCTNLTPDARCKIYEKRPLVCRQHSAENCEYTGDVDFQEFLSKPEDLVALMKKRGVSYRMPWLDGGKGA